MSRQYLLVRSQQDENCYGPFTEEILTSEGLNCFQTVDLDASEFPAIAPDDLVLLTRCFLREKELDALVQAVEAGARLLSVHPSTHLVTRLGWVPQNRVAYPGRVVVRSGYPGARVALQTHVPILLCKPAQRSVDYRIVAAAAQEDGRELGYSAIVRQAVGAGEVALVLYDLPKAVARIRLGDPELASIATSGVWDWPHAGDLFAGFADEALGAVPQADLHCQLLAKLLTEISPQPLARLWYYEDARHRTAAVFSSDDDWSTPEQFEELSSTLVKHGGRGTFYLVKDTRLGDEQIRLMRQLGHTFAPHVNAYGEDEMYFGFPAAIAEETARLEDRIGALSPSLQTHCAPWYGYLDYVTLCRKHGYRMLMQYISIPVERLHTYMCGSGRPMKFVDLDGTIFDCWQQPGAVFDDASLIEEIRTNLDGVLARFNALLTGAIYDHHTPFAIASHPVSFSTYSRPYIEGCFEAFSRKQLPIYNADDWCALADRRRAARITFEGREGATLAWSVTGLDGQLPLMVPAVGVVTREAAVRVDGAPVESSWQRRLEEDYLFVQLSGDRGKAIRVEVDLAGG